MDVARLAASPRHGWLTGAAILLSLVLGCAKAEDEPDQVDPEARIVDLYHETARRLLAAHVDGAGWVVSRDAGGAPARVGEALLWSGVALAALPCDRGDAIEAQLQDMIRRHAGALVRYEPLGEYEGGREVSFDGAVGLYRGIAARVARCGAGAWEEILALHREFLDAHDGRLHENVSATMAGGFDYVLDLLAHRLALRGAPHDDALSGLGSAIAGWAAAVNASHAACYRINLSLLALETVEDLGATVPGAVRDAFCAATRGTGILTVEHYCGRDDGALARWIDDFQPDQWEYAWQRCPSWESPDGNGLSAPRLDLLVAIRRVYRI